MAEKMGFEGLLYWGAAGSSASTQVLIARDVSTTTDPTKAPTTVRGAGSTPPLITEDVVAVAWSCDFNLVNEAAGAGLTALAALRAAAAAGTSVALRMKDHAAGMGYDGDVTVSCKNGQPYQGEQTFDFTATPTKQDGRDPQFYV